MGEERCSIAGAASVNLAAMQRASNVGLKPPSQVKDEMDRFMREVAPGFEGMHRKQRV
jgi:hypothetical protein